MRPRAGLASVLFPAAASSLPELRKQFVCRRIVFCHPCPARLRCFVFLHHTFQSQSQGPFRTSVLLEGNWMMALKPYFGKNRVPEPLQAAEPAELCHCSADRTQCGSSPHVGSGIIAASPMPAVAKPGAEQTPDEGIEGISPQPSPGISSVLQ